MKDEVREFSVTTGAVVITG